MQVTIQCQCKLQNSLSHIKGSIFKFTNSLWFHCTFNKAALIVSLSVGFFSLSSAHGAHCTPPSSPLFSLFSPLHHLILFFSFFPSPLYTTSNLLAFSPLSFFSPPMVSTFKPTCIADANPWSPAVWILDTNAGNITLPTDSEGAFKITFAKESDSGWYRCVTYNHQQKLYSSYAYYLHVRDKMPQGLPASFRPCNNNNNGNGKVSNTQVSTNSQHQSHQGITSSGSSRVTSAKTWNASSATTFKAVNNVTLFTCFLYITLNIVKTSLQFT